MHWNCYNIAGDVCSRHIMHSHSTIIPVKDNGFRFDIKSSLLKIPGLVRVGY